MFITIEGPEGSGKTSHIPPLVEYLRRKGYVVFPTREPGVDRQSANRSTGYTHHIVLIVSDLERFSGPMIYF